MLDTHNPSTMLEFHELLVIGDRSGSCDRQHMGADGHGWRQSRVDEHVANMQDKNENGYGYGYNYINLQPLTRGTIAEIGGHAMTKTKSYLIMGGEHRYLF